MAAVKRQPSAPARSAMRWRRAVGSMLPRHCPCPRTGPAKIETAVARAIGEEEESGISC